jgi:hypothetical protein
MIVIIELCMYFYTSEEYFRNENNSSALKQLLLKYIYVHYQVIFVVHLLEKCTFLLSIK